MKNKPLPIASSRPLPIAVSMGEPAGIGLDLIIELYSLRNEMNLPPFIVYGNSALIRQRAKHLGKKIAITECLAKDASSYFANYLPIFNIGENFIDSPKIINKQTAKITIQSIEKAAEDNISGQCKALVTAPIQKSALYDAGFKFAGHTEFLASLCKENEQPPFPIMMLAHENLRVVPLTIHVPLKQVPKLLTKQLIISSAKIIANDLQKRFNIRDAKLAICGLNPHAGEGGTIGLEDRDIIAPSVKELQQFGINIVGPLPADTIFYPPHWKKYDVILATYHDQALIPIKTLAFDKGVNITLGLPIIRTSPDHGTALDLAGSGNASISSMLAALRMADKMSMEVE